MPRSNVTQSRAGGYLPSVIATLAFIGTFLFNAFSFAALASHAEIGRAFRNAIENDSPFIEGYVWVGDRLRLVPGLSGWGDTTANAAAEPLVARIKPFPPGASAVFFGDIESGAQSRMRWGHRLLPFLAVIGVIAWSRRQKPVHMVKRYRA